MIVEMAAKHSGCSECHIETTELHRKVYSDNKINFNNVWYYLRLVIQSIIEPMIGEIEQGNIQVERICLFLYSPNKSV